MQAKGKSGKRQTKLELYVSWMLGGLLLLIANSTFFKRYGASIGEPWLNLLLSALVLLMLGKIAVSFLRMQQKIKEDRANIAAIDKMNSEAFFHYMEAFFRHQGWNVRTDALDGSELLAERDGKRLLVVLRCSKRKLTHETVLLAESLRDKYQADEARVITNGSFTSQARREAERLHIGLWDRKELIRQLARINAAWKLRPIGR